MPPKRSNFQPSVAGESEASQRAAAVMAAKKKQQKKLQEQQAELLRAVKAGQVGEVLRMVDSDAGVIKLPEPVNGHADAVGWLLDQHPPPLIVAAGLDLRQVVELLLAHPGIEVNVQANHGGTALILASQKGHQHVVKLLLAHSDIEVNVQENQGVTALDLASYEGHQQVVELLLAHPGIEVNVPNNQGWTALSIASQNGHQQVVELLLAHSGIEVNVQDNQGATALSIASQDGQHQVVKLLLAHSGIEVNVQDNQGATALSIASQEGHHKVVELLLAQKKTEAAARHTGHSESESSWLRELLHSVQTKAWEKAKELLDDPKSTTPSWTALHDAASEGHAEVIDALLHVSPGLLNEALANNGRTALHLAASLGHLDAVRKLLEHGADASVETTFSKCTPLQLAAEAGHLKVVMALLEGTPCAHRRTALLWAIKEGHEDVAMVLRDAGVEVTEDAVNALPPRFVSLEDFEGNLGTDRCRLGKGTFGFVHMGIDCRDGDLIAIKRAKTKDERYKKPPPGASEKTLKETKAVDTDLEEEFHLHESLRHRNILPVYRKRLGDDGYWRIHMQLMRGKSLETKAKGAGLDEAHVRRYLSDALEGLQYLHKKEVCHFDIKPGNMLLDDDDRLVLSDFGLSREGFDNTENPGGTLYYKAPELVNKKTRPGPAADIWALACSVIFMATGKHPWTTNSTEPSSVEVKLMLEEETHPPFRDDNGELLPGISLSLEDLLKKVFDADPKTRYSAFDCQYHPFVTGAPFTPAPKLRDQQPITKPTVAATAGGGGGVTDMTPQESERNRDQQSQQPIAKPAAAATAGGGGMAPKEANSDL